MRPHFYMYYTGGEHGGVAGESNAMLVTEIGSVADVFGISVGDGHMCSECVSVSVTGTCVRNQWRSGGGWTCWGKGKGKGRGGLDGCLLTNVNLLRVTFQYGARKVTKMGGSWHVSILKRV
jgi:hypothetical protein